MANNIYHKSNWGSPEKDGWGDVYFNPSATNKLYSRSDNYENSDGTDKALDKKPDTQSILMTPTAYDVSSMNSILPKNGNGDFTFDRSSTATRVNKEGLIETVAIDTPRLDYPLIDGVVQSEPALLLEPSRTNLITYSEDFTGWSLTSASKSLDSSVVSPEGSSGVQKLTSSIGSSFHFALFSVTLTGKQSFSVFLKKGTVSQASLFLSEVGNFGAIFDLENGLVESVSGSDNTAEIHNYGNGWYRCIVNHTSTDDLVNQVRIGVNNGAIGGFNADGTEAIYIYGAQVEAGSYATSYIPTSGSSVTRSAETCNSAGTSDDFNDSEGVLYAEIAALADDSTYKRIALSNGSTTNRVAIGTNNTSDTIRCFVASGGSLQADFLLGISDITLSNKIALKYKANDFSLFINGFEVGTDTSGSAPTGLNTVRFEDGDGGYDFYGKTKELAVFKEALTDSELEALTSWTSFNDMAIGQEYTIR